MIAIFVLGALAVTAVGGGIAVYKITSTVEENLEEKKAVNDNVTGAYYSTLKLFEDILNKEVELKLEVNESKKSGMDEYSAKNKYSTIYINETQKGSYNIEIKKAGNKVLSLELEKDGNMVNVKYEKELALGGDMKEYVLKLKELLDLFLSTVKDKNQKEIEAKMIFENINILNSTTKLSGIPNIEKVEILLKEKYFKEEEISKKTVDSLNIARVLYNMEEYLTVENKHDLNKILEERLYNVLYHYDKLMDKEKVNKKEELISGLNVVSEKLNNIVEEVKKGHEIEFEKQITLIKK